MGFGILDALNLYPAAVGRALARQAALEWAGTPIHRAMLARPKPIGQATAPHDLRPTDPIGGAAILAGAFDLAGARLVVGRGGDPWDRPAPSRRFAVGLHRFDWLPGLLSQGPDGAREAARLTELWRAQFGAWNLFAWSPEVLERRVFALACGLEAISAAAPDQAESVRETLAAQTRALLGSAGSGARRAERAAAAATAAAALDFGPRNALLDRALHRLSGALPTAVRADGGHATRSPQAGLELLYDLRTLVDVLERLGRRPPPEVLEAGDRMGAAVKFFTAPGGRLAAFQGGEAAAVDAAAISLDGGKPGTALADSGYHRLDGRGLVVFVDAGAPAAGPDGASACAQPLALEVYADGKPLFVGGGWSAEALAPPALRLSAAACTLTLDDASPGEPLIGRLARALGPRLINAPRIVEAKRHQDGAATWLELSHDGWRRTFGVRHERRLFVDRDSEDLRGEEAIVPAGGPRRPLEAAVRFHLPREVTASIARDGRSVLLRGASGRGWRLRSDAAEHLVEASAQVLDHRPHRTTQVVLKSTVRPTLGAKIRWKLSPAEDA